MELIEMSWIRNTEVTSIYASQPTSLPFVCLGRLGTETSGLSLATVSMVTLFRVVDPGGRVEIAAMTYKH